MDYVSVLMGENASRSITVQVHLWCGGRLPPPASRTSVHGWGCWKTPQMGLLERIL